MEEERSFIEKLFFEIQSDYKVTLKEIGKRCRICAPTISLIKNGGRTLTPEHYQKIIKLFPVSEKLDGKIKKFLEEYKGGITWKQRNRISFAEAEAAKKQQKRRKYSF